MLVLAGPGSGKTFVMVHRVQHLISHYHVNPASILVISFTKASAVQLRERFFKLNPVHAHQVNFSTFHSCFFHILKVSCHYKATDIMTPKEQDDFMKILLNDPVYEEENSVQIREGYLHKISYYKNKGPGFMEKTEPALFQKLFLAYQELIHSHHKMDFDDMGLLCLKLFREKPQLLRHWQRQYRYILIDEFQDINPIQFSICRKLTEGENNLFVVGDDDQAIYSFRGASPKIMLGFTELYPEAKQILLETNFRCSANIVSRSLKVIENNKQRFSKEIVSANPPKEQVVVKAFKNRTAEYAYLLERINRLLSRGTDPAQIACIFRTNADMAPLAASLSRRRIPFSMKDRIASIYRHFLATDILSYLSFFYEGKKRGDFYRIMNKPLRYLSRSSCEDGVISWSRLRSYYFRKPQMLRAIRELELHEQRIGQMDLYAAVVYIRKVVGYETYAMEEGRRKGMAADEIREILDFLQESFAGMRDLEEYRRSVKDYEDALAAADGQEGEGIRLVTMHGCKGLEYDYVFLPDCNEGKLPHKRAKQEEEIEEERRMFYVAMTRAREKLEILYLEDKGSKRHRPSRFLVPIKKE